MACKISQGNTFLYIRDNLFNGIVPEWNFDPTSLELYVKWGAPTPLTHLHDDENFHTYIKV